MSATFEHLLAPVTAADFFRRHWENTPLVVQQRDPRHYESLLTLKDLDLLLGEGGLQHPGLRLVRRGQALPRSLYTADLAWGDGVFHRSIEVERVLAEYRAGATVVFQALHRNHGPLGRLCRDLERRFAFRFQANVYLTPPGERGLGVHFDRHDVFVLQIHGSKDWTVWDAALKLPSRRHHFDAETTDPGEPIHRLTLTAGDPFHPDNVARLRLIGLMLAGLELGRYAFWAVSAWLFAGVNRVEPSFGLTAWFSVLVVFVLAEVFREGARLRREAELTI